MLLQAEHLLRDVPKLTAQMQEANDLNIPYVVIFGEDELKAGVVQLKHLLSQKEKDAGKEAPPQETVKLEDLPAAIRAKFATQKH